MGNRVPKLPHKGFNGSFRSAKPSLTRPVRVRIERLDPVETLTALANITQRFGSKKMLLLDISMAKGTMTPPPLKPVFLPKDGLSFSNFDQALAYFAANKDSLVKGWVMIKGKAPGNCGAWQHDVSITPDRLSIDGKTRPTKDFTKALRLAKRLAAPSIKRGDLTSPLFQCGAIFDSELPGTKAFGPKAWSTNPSSKLIFRSTSSIGLINADDALLCIQNALSSPDNPAADVVIFQSLVWGFDRGIRIERNLEKDNTYDMTIEIDPVGRAIERNVSRSVHAAV